MTSLMLKAAGKGRAPSRENGGRKGPVPKGQVEENLCVRNTGNKGIQSSNQKPPSSAELAVQRALRQGD